MTTAFIFTPVGLISAILFLYFVTLSGFVFIIGKLDCTAQTTGKIAKQTWQRIVKFLIKKMMFLPYRAQP